MLCYLSITNALLSKHLNDLCGEITYKWLSVFVDSFGRKMRKFERIQVLMSPLLKNALVTHLPHNS
jgi:hypothetical protein